MDKSKLAVNTYNKIASIYANNYFNDLSEVSYIDLFLNKLPKNGSILDVGCGPGQFTQYMLSRSFQVTGVEYSESMISIAQQKVPEGTFLQMDMRHMDFENEHFDGLLAAYSLIHIPTEEIPHTLKGFYYVLNAGGYIEIVAQKGESDKVITEPFMPEEKMFFNFFTKEKLETLLIDAGFTIEYFHEGNSIDPDSVSSRIFYVIAKKY